MDSKWKNQTQSPKPNQHPLACWFEEVFNSTKKCLKWCSFVRCLLFVAGLVPGSGLDGWHVGPQYRQVWNLWGPQEGPSGLFAFACFVLCFLSRWIADFIPTFGQPVEDKPYHTFEKFWPRYLNEHNNPVDRVGHVFEFFGVFVFMALDVRRFTAFSLTLALGTLLTRPLLHIERPRIENDLMYVIGALVATIYGVPISYALGYAVWLAFDFTGHAYLGDNASAAAFLGRHYLGWALVGQSWFACQVAANFPAEVGEAIRYRSATRAAS